MANFTYTAPNQAVYEPHSPYEGALGFQHGAVETNGSQIIALHPNGDGSVSGVTDEGVVVQV